MVISFSSLAPRAAGTVLLASFAGLAGADSIDSIDEALLGQFGLQLCIGTECEVGTDGRFVDPEDGSVFNLAPVTSLDPATGHFMGMGMFMGMDMDAGMDSTGPGFSGAIAFGGNVDPDMAISGVVFDYGDPTLFTFLARAPLLPAIAGPVQISGDMSASCTDMNSDQRCGTGAGALSPALMNLMINDTVSAGPALGSDSIVAAPMGSAVVPASTGSATFDCTTLVGGCTHMTALLSFMGSGGGDMITFNGKYLITASVPEPMDGVLMMSGLLALVLLRQGRSATQLPVGAGH